MSNLIPDHIINQEFEILALGGKHGYGLMVVTTAEIIMTGTWEEVHACADEHGLILN